MAPKSQIPNLSPNSHLPPISHLQFSSIQISFLPSSSSPFPPSFPFPQFNFSQFSLHSASSLFFSAIFLSRARVQHMGFSKKHNHVEIRNESEGKKWVIAGIAIRAPLKPISTRAAACEVEDEDGACSTTPTARESMIPEIGTCPPAPRKRRPSSKPRFNGVVEFFNPPDLESVFQCRCNK